MAILQQYFLQLTAQSHPPPLALMQPYWWRACCMVVPSNGGSGGGDGIGQWWTASRNINRKVKVVLLGYTQLFHWHVSKERKGEGHLGKDGIRSGTCWCHLEPSFPNPVSNFPSFPLPAHSMPPAPAGASGATTIKAGTTEHLQHEPRGAGCVPTFKLS